MGEHYRCGDVCHPSMPPWENAVHILNVELHNYSIITLITIIVTITITFINIIITN